MQSIWTFEELQRVLDDEFPGLKVFRWPSGRWSIEQEYDEVRVCELDPSYAIDGFGYKETGYQMVLDVKNRLVGGWVLEELRKRDPRYARNEGNLFHQAYLLSKQAEVEHEKRNQHARESALASWDTVMRTPTLLNRIMDKLAKGDSEGATQELTLERMCINAAKENNRELRSKDFWKHAFNR